MTICIALRPLFTRMTDKVSQEILDNIYTTEFILQNERWFGENYSSAGGEAATKDLLLHAGLKPNEKVLDIGCGQGGPSMYMARHYGVHVHGIDFSNNLINLGRQRLAACEPIVQQRVQLEHADASIVQLRKDYYDIIYSKDSCYMIPAKKKLFENLMNCIQPGGRLFITEWCKGDSNLPEIPITTTAPRVKWPANCLSVSANIKFIEAAGFKNVKVKDLSKEIINHKEKNLRQFEATKQAFIQDFDSESYQATIDRCNRLVAMTKEGARCWVLFTATA